MLRPYVFGIGTHFLVPSAFRTICPLAEADTDAALEVAEGDDHNVKSLKSLKKGHQIVRSGDYF